MSAPDRADVIVIGAGAAGLACARQLIRDGFKVVLLEARDRVGGRAYSATEAGFAQPIEYGAEFIHGASTTLLRELDAAGMSFNDVTDSRYVLKRGKLSRDAFFWDRLQEVMDRLKIDRTPDRTVLEFLEQQSKHLPKDEQRIFRNYVEGYQAAELHKMGERALAAAEQGEEAALNGIALFRPSEGYTHLMQSYLQDTKLSASLQLNTIVRTIEWQTGRVRVLGVRISGVRSS
ncbi:MAG: FAD-dependent oxidoreductase, partial [Proteobacteria bacterium]